MKVNRHSHSKEKNTIDSLWLYEFAYDLEKNAQNIDFLKDYLDKTRTDKGFNTIDEKMADIRERVGFDLAKKVVNEIEKISSEKTASHGCGCSPVKSAAADACACPIKTAAMTHPHEDVELMGNILKYIKDMVQHESHLDSATILHRCKNEEGLRYGDLEQKIDRAKLVSYINDLLGSDAGPKDQLATYVPQDLNHVADFESGDAQAEYYNHAEPK